MSTADVRRAFLEFFRERGHTVVPSSSLVPGNDPTLLFTNAGMVQFKDVFLGKEQRDYTRAASSQRCVRAGGKHNDLENVGYTARHHTFFEMLGNFSFGDYFKRDAIRYAWEFVTGKEWLNISPERLMVTVYYTDDEAYEIWHKDIGLAPQRIVRIGDKEGGGSDNFWQMGDTGPCGPCSEIFYDHGPDVPGGPPGSPEADGDRWIEIWNLVFMQYDRTATEGICEDETAAQRLLAQVQKNGQSAQINRVLDAGGKAQYRVVQYQLTPLPKPSVDTGMGLERAAAVMQGVHSNYEIDLFQTLIREAARLLKTQDLDDPSLRVIADHIRAAGFLICDGVVPANEGRGYVLRRIVRRAMRHGYKFGQSPEVFHHLVPTLAAAMGEAYPQLRSKQSFIQEVLAREGEQFARTLETGMVLLEQAIKEQAARGTSTGRIPGETVFKLYDTYGFPVDLTADIARERGLTVDQEGFEAAMQQQRERARAASRFGVDLRADATQLQGLEQLEAEKHFSGYERVSDTATIVALLRGKEQVQALRAGEEGQVVLDHTPFYAESGGQVGDSGALENPGAGVRFEVRDTQKLGSANAHIGQLTQGELRVGDTVTAHVDVARRDAIRLNHTATHLLHAALRKVLGTHVQQKGSLVAPDRLRFDFAHFQPVTAQELREIERLVNTEIRRNTPAETQLMDYDSAVAAGAMALFGEKYAKNVRVLRLGEFSVELCGGTHVQRAGDIGLFKIVSESGVAAGVRRIEAVTGEGALDYVDRNEALLRELAALFRSSREEVREKARDALERIRQMEKEIRTLKDRLASGQGSDLSASAIDIDGVKVISTQVPDADANALRSAVDQLKTKLKSAVIVLASVQGPSKVVLVAGVTQDQTARVKAGELVGAVASQLGGRGGGRPDFAQAGGSDPAALAAALASVEGWVRAKLSA